MHFAGLHASLVVISFSDFIFKRQRRSEMPIRSVKEFITADKSKGGFTIPVTLTQQLASLACIKVGLLQLPPFIQHPCQWKSHLQHRLQILYLFYLHGWKCPFSSGPVLCLSRQTALFREFTLGQIQIILKALATRPHSVF